MAKGKPQSIPLAGSRPSITRSDALSGPLHEAGLGVPRLVIELERMLAATVTQSHSEPDPKGKSNITVEVEKPDWKTRGKAIDMLALIHGYAYAPQKAQDQDPLVVIINKLPEQVREKLLTTIQNRLVPLTMGEN